MDLKKDYSGCKQGSRESFLKYCYPFSTNGEYRFVSFLIVRAIHPKIQGKGESYDRRTKILESSHGDAAS